MNQPQPPARHALRLHVLASGSSGNAAVVENAATGRGILIDCGICKRDFFARCKEAGFDPVNLEGVLITHDHTDHTKGLGVVLRGLAKLGVHPSVCTGPAVRDASKYVREVLDTDLAPFVPFAAGDALSLAGCQVHVLQSSHDAADSFGFRVEAPDLPEVGGTDSLGYLTDSGVVTPQCHEGLSQVRLLALESNHDPHMLKTGPYPYHIKQRVASDFGHLSNQQSCAELAGLLHSGLEQVVAMHVSRNNNTYRLPLETLRAGLQEQCHGAQISVAYQDRLVSVV
ncbi:MAG: MBL fold metallo-hydrolase [Coriobacteriia bacterium]|nr:MBL fold metallo-hydrolase [Coriobacteriia bacterium]